MAISSTGDSLQHITTAIFFLGAATFTTILIHNRRRKVSKTTAKLEKIAPGRIALLTCQEP